MEVEKTPLVIVTGPTAVGKTNLSVAFAKQMGGEIISADSMQVYRHMNIGSAKIRPQETKGVPHHLIDLIEPTQAFNITLFQKYAREYIGEIRGRGHLPVLAGGTGFYIQSVLYDIDFTQEADDGACRQELEALCEERGGEWLHTLLAQADPEAARQIHPHNRKRVIRALEYYRLTGQRISEHNEQQREKKSRFRFCYFVLNDDRRKLYEKIDRRVDQMMADGLVEEVRELRRMGCLRDMTSMQGLGYKEIFDYLDGRTTLEEAVYLIKRDTRHFAKRQLTWFRREKDVIWVEKERFGGDEEKILAYMREKMREKGIREII